MQNSLNRVLSKMPKGKVSPAHLSKRKIELADVNALVNNIYTTESVIQDRLTLIENALAETLEWADTLIEMQERLTEDVNPLYDAFDTLKELGVDVPDNMMNAMNRAEKYQDYKFKELKDLLKSTWDKLEV